MALTMNNFALKLSKDEEGNLVVVASYVKQSTESADLTRYTELAITPSQVLLDELAAAYEALKADVKTSQNLE